MLPVIAHETNTAGTARMTLFVMNPLYRADPEREWLAVGAAAYWADQWGLPKPSTYEPVAGARTSMAGWMSRRLNFI